MNEVILHVLIPTYNCGSYIANAIDSILSQGIEGIRITVVDNASTDNTNSIVEKYKPMGVDYLKNDSNIGGIENHNKCLDIASGKYVKLMSADDVLLPGVLSAQIRALEGDSEVGVVSCNCIITDENLKPIRNVRFLTGAWHGRAVIKKCVNAIDNMIGGPTNVMMRRSAVGLSRWDKNYAWTADLMFFCELLLKHNYVGLDIDGYLYRRHSGSISNTICPLPVRMKSDAHLIWRFSKTKLQYARWIWRYTRIYFRRKCIGCNLI